MKKIIISSLLIIFAGSLFKTFYFYISPILMHQTVIENAHKYKPYYVESFDGKYVLQTEKIEDNTGVYASFHIAIKETNEIVFKSNENYRTMDLKTISWSENSLNVIVESGDVGSIIYLYDDNKWLKQ